MARNLLRIQQFMGQAQLGTAVGGVSSSLAAEGEALAGTSRRLAAKADGLAARAGELAGTEAALSGKPQLRRSGSTYSDAFDAAAMTTYANKLSTQLIGQAQAVVDSAGADPAALSAGFDQLRERMLAEDVIPDPVARATFETQFGRIRMAAERRVGREAARLGAAQTRMDAEGAVDAQRANLRAQASAYGFDQDGLAATEAEATNTVDVIRRNAAIGVLTPAQAARLEAGVQYDRAAGHIAGAYELLGNDAARRDFIDQLEDDHAAGRGVVKGMPEPAFRGIVRDLDRRARAAERATARDEAQQQGATEKAGLALLADGKLDRGWLDANADTLSMAAFRRFDRALSVPPAAATDPQTYGHLLLEASDDPQNAVKGAFDAYRDGRLDRAAFNKIHGAAMRAEQGDRPEWVGELRRDLLTRLQPGDRQAPGEAVRQLDAGDAFESWVAANPGATAEQARDAADALVDRYRGAAVKNERNELPLPRFVTEAREKVGVDTLRAAATRLKAAIDAGDLTETEQRAEIENLRRWGDLLRRDTGKK